MKRGVLLAQVLAALAVFAACSGESDLIGSSGGPGLGDHWHASYEVSVCGKVLPPFGGSPGGVHTHGDGLFHIHPRTGSEAGSNANLALFFDSVGGTLRDDGLTLPFGETYTNGDLCPDGQPGQFSVTVNGVVQETLSTYAPQDGDEVSIAF